MSTFVKNTIFFIGWMLSPLTFWNDVFVNIPIAYICATILVKVVKADFLFTVLIFYWLSNLFGILMMITGGKSIIRDKSDRLRSLITLLITIVIYSVIIIILNRTGILKPI